MREYVFLYDPGHPQYKNILKKAEAWREISEELYQTSKFVFLTYFYLQIVVYYFLTCYIVTYNVQG